MGLPREVGGRYNRGIAWAIQLGYIWQIAEDALEED